MFSVVSFSEISILTYFRETAKMICPHCDEEVGKEAALSGICPFCGQEIDLEDALLSEDKDEEFDEEEDGSDSDDEDA